MTLSYSLIYLPSEIVCKSQCFALFQWNWSAYFFEAVSDWIYKRLQLDLTRNAYVAFWDSLEGVNDIILGNDILNVVHWAIYFHGRTRYKCAKSTDLSLASIRSPCSGFDLMFPLQLQ